MKKYFQNKNDSIFTNTEIKYIWDYTCDNFLNKRKLQTTMTFSDILNRVSEDLGLTSNQVRSALYQNKGMKEMLSEFELTQNKLVQAVKDAKNWLNKEIKDNS